MLEWREDVGAAEWDRALAALGGHPLQSALWGDARHAVDGVADHRWVALKAGVAQWMIRIEERRVPLVGWVGWAPKGPTGKPPDADDLPAALRTALGSAGMVLLATDRWRRHRGVAVAIGRQPQTIWIDLASGRERLWQGLDKQWRYGVGRARRLGVTVGAETGRPVIEAFAALCGTVSLAKRFRLRPSLASFAARLLDGPDGGAIEARLMIARHEDEIAAGAFLIRCGRSLHYLWGATDRAAARTRAGEAVQWAAIKWGLARGCTRYDLEGIDPAGNPGVHAFKKKMGGEELALEGKHYYPLVRRGSLIAWLDARRSRYGAGTS